MTRDFPIFSGTANGLAASEVSYFPDGEISVQLAVESAELEEMYVYAFPHEAQRRAAAGRGDGRLERHDVLLRGPSRGRSDAAKLDRVETDRRGRRWTAARTAARASALSRPSPAPRTASAPWPAVTTWAARTAATTAGPPRCAQAA